MWIEDRRLEGRWDDVSRVIQTDARWLLRKGLSWRIAYEDLYQAGWLGAMRAINKLGEGWMLTYVRKAAYGEMLREIERSGIFCRCKSASYYEVANSNKHVAYDVEALSEVVDTRQNFEGWTGWLKEALYGLGDRQRQAIELYYVGGIESSSVVEREFGNVRSCRESHRGAIEALRNHALRGGLEV